MYPLQAQITVSLPRFKIEPEKYLPFRRFILVKSPKGAFKGRVNELITLWLFYKSTLAVNGSSECCFRICIIFD